MNDLLYLEFRNHDGRPLRLDMADITRIVTALAECIQFSATGGPELGLSGFPKVSLFLNDAMRGSIRFGFLPEITDEAIKKVEVYDKLLEVCWKWVKRALFMGVATGNFVLVAPLLEGMAEKLPHASETEHVRAKLDQLSARCALPNVDEVVITDRDGMSCRIVLIPPRDVRLIGSMAGGGYTESKHVEGKLTLSGGGFPVVAPMTGGGAHEISLLFGTFEEDGQVMQGYGVPVLVKWQSKRDPSTIAFPVRIRGVTSPISDHVQKAGADVTEEAMHVRGVVIVQKVIIEE